MVLVTVLWGSTFPLVKELVAQVSPALMLAARFTVAALVLAPWLRQVSRALWLEGALLGGVLFASYWTQAIGMTTIPSGRAAFITGLNVILVPLMLPFLKRRVPWPAFVAAALALGGIGLMSLSSAGLEFGIGDLWVLGCAFSYAVYILLVDRAVARHATLPLAAVQVTVVCVLGWAAAAPEIIGGSSLNPLRDSGLPALRDSSLTGLLQFWPQLVFLGVMATALTTLMQAYAQRFLAAFQIATLSALEPVWAAIFGFFLLSERLSERGLIGAGLILLAMVLSQFDPQSDKHPKSVSERV